MIKQAHQPVISLLLWCCFSMCSIGQLQADPNDNRLAPIFISLGSHCEPSQQLILNNLRSAAFPFDWLLTLDFEGFLALIQEDFRFFMDKRYIIQNDENALINTYYHIDLRHEMHDWPDADFPKHYSEIKEKYQRRINRFKECNYNKSRAYFIRAAFDLELNPKLPTITQDCTRIEKNQAETLKNLLRKKFPQLDFYLVIINYAEENIEAILGIDRVIEFKIRKSHRNEDYKNLFQQLIEHAQQL